MLPHLIRLLALMVISPLALAAAPCRRKCGNMDVPYPFGILGDGPDCYLNETYAVSCDTNSTPPVAFLLVALSIWPDTFLRTPNATSAIYNISVEDHELRVAPYGSASNVSLLIANWSSSIFYQQMPARFPISSTKNVFTAIGCHIYAILYESLGDGYDYARGCFTTCTGPGNRVNGSCSGIGCCQTSLPKSAYSVEITLSSYTSRSLASGYSDYRAAYIVANDSFHFSTEYLTDPFNIADTPQMVRDWSVGDRNCTEAKMNMTSYICKGNSTCSDDDNGLGYRCSCRKGYKGNPYLSGDGGCQRTFCSSF